MSLKDIIIFKLTIDCLSFFKIENCLLNETEVIDLETKNQIKNTENELSIGWESYI